MAQQTILYLHSFASSAVSHPQPQAKMLISKPGGVISVGINLPQRFKRDLAQQVVDCFCFLGLIAGHPGLFLEKVVNDN